MSKIYYINIYSTAYSREMKAIILAGGLGTRLSSHLPGVPKSMADISGRPFLEYLLDHLIKNNINEVMISVHHLKEKIINHFGNDYKSIKISYSIEPEPLGTGGAILNSMNSLNYDDKFLVINGDCFQNIYHRDFYNKNKDNNLSLVIREAEDTSRYGRIEINGNSIISFEEKGITGKGYINAGCYLIDSKWFRALELPQKFSFENDFMKKYVGKIDVPYYIADGYFIDIGIPEDYLKAQKEIPNFFKVA